MITSKQKKLLAIALVLLAAVALLAWPRLHPSNETSGLVSGNGRIEATEIDVAAKLGGRIVEMFVNEGDFVERGQPLAQMQIEVLEAQRREAQASHEQALHAIASAEAMVGVRQSELAVAQAVVQQREAEVDAAQRRLQRSATLSTEGAASIQELDDNRAALRSAQAALAAAKAQVASARAAIEAAQAQVIGARSAARAIEATIARIEADIADSQLTAPRAGRVQYRIAQVGEVVGAGGKVLNLVDLSDVYMSFFLPETAAGRVAIGDEVRIVLDAAPQWAIPARVSFVSATAQFTPKTVETASERQKLMFRVKAQIDPELLKKHIEMVKTGLPGVAWLQLDDAAAWPEDLDARLLE